MAKDIGATSFVHNETYDIQFLIEHGRRKWKRRLCWAIFGEYKDCSEFDKVLTEIYKYKWIRCEEAGKDLYGEGDDGIIKAGIEWRLRESSTTEPNDTRLKILTDKLTAEVDQHLELMMKAFREIGTPESRMYFD